MCEPGKETKKKPMTDEERLALAAKLDQELDDFIAGLEKRKYAEGWPEDRWQEEMEKHPFFMTKLPEDGKLSPLLEGIQQLKYDENENTPLELAASYKEDGNFNFKYKKYRMAILSYSEGIRRKCGNPDMEAQLYNNRAAAQFHLQNYRSSLADYQHALKIQPDYLKAKLKAAECCVKLKMLKEAIDYCDEILEKSPNDSVALKIRAEALAVEKQQNRDKRKQKVEETKAKMKLQTLKSAIESRKLSIKVKGDILDSLEFSSDVPVLENNELSWFVVFNYPEFSISDSIQQFNENSTFYDHLVVMFEEPPFWDTELKYRPDNLAVYHENEDGSKLYPVDVRKTLSEVLIKGQYIIKDWRLEFWIVVKGSSQEDKFLKNYSLVNEF